MLGQLAASEAVLIPDEKELGAVLVDIGGGTTDLVVFSQGAVRQTAVFGLGGNHLTNDIAVGLRTPLVESEKIKTKYGCALTAMVKKEEMIEVPSVGGRRLAQSFPADSGRDHRAPDGGNFQPGAPGDPEVRV